MAPFIAAVVQNAPVVFDACATLNKIDTLTAEAAKTGATLDRLSGGVRLGLPEGARLRRAGRDAILRGARHLPPLLRQRHRRARSCDRGVVEDREEARRLPRARRDRARDRHALLHRAVLRAGRHAARQASQADADGDGAAHLGLRRRIDPAGVCDAARQARRRDLLGELHAAAADGDVRQGHPAVLRADRRRPRHLAVVDAACRTRGALLRVQRLPAPAPRGLSCRLRRDAGRRSRHRADARRQRDRRAARTAARRTDLQRERDPDRRDRSRRDHPLQVRPRRRRPLRAARHLPAARQREERRRRWSASSA